MDLLKKVETLINATARAKLPRRERRTILDDQEEELLTKIRQALAKVQAQERVLFQRMHEEETQAQDAAQRGDWDDRRVHERRATELERHLEEEGIRAIDLEEKLSALEEKLAQAKAAVEKEAQAVARREEAADKILAGRTDEPDSARLSTDQVARSTASPDNPDDDVDLEARKARLSD
jgi:hypothetical protein